MDLHDDIIKIALRSINQDLPRKRKVLELAENMTRVCRLEDEKKTHDAFFKAKTEYEYYLKLKEFAVKMLAKSGR